MTNTRLTIPFLLFLLLITRQSISAQDYKLVWSDEFTKEGKVDESVWTFETGFERNNEDQWYQKENAYCKDGFLIIEARKEEKDNPRYKEGSTEWRDSRKKIQYTSSCIKTINTKQFLYGRFEVRAKIPVSKGSWPAIWFLGRGMSWPSCGEIDLMEFYHIKGVPHILANVAWGGEEKYSAIWDDEKIPFSHFKEKDPYWESRFHIWRMDWDEKSIKLYLDNELLNEVPLSKTVNGSLGNFENPFNKPQYILLNLALGGNNGGPIDDSALPMKYIIDYVRVYQKVK